MPETSQSVPVDELDQELHSVDDESVDEPGLLHRIFLGTNASGFIARMTLIPLFIYLAIFAFGFAWAWFAPENAANTFGLLRNLLEIVLALAAMIIFVATGIMIIQIARFVNLLRSEIKPITEDAKAAVKDIRVTAEFVQKHGIEPIIRIQSFLFALSTFLIELVRVTRLLQNRKDTEPTADSKNDDALEVDEYE